MTYDDMRINTLATLHELELHVDRMEECDSFYVASLIYYLEHEATLITNHEHRVTEMANKYLGDSDGLHI